MAHLGPAASSALSIPASLGIHLGPGSPGLGARGVGWGTEQKSWPQTHSAVKALSSNCRLILEEVMKQQWGFKNLLAILPCGFVLHSIPSKEEGAEHVLASSLRISSK